MLNSASEAKGRWLDTAVGKMPKGKIEWRAPAGTGIQAHVGVIAGQSIATVKKQPYHPEWIARLTGWMWTVDPDSSAARMGVKEAPVIAFKRRTDAQKAIQAAIDSLP